MQRLALDMDGVIADVYSQFFEWDEKEFGKRRTIEEVTGKKESDAFPMAKKYVYTAGFFTTAPVMKGSREIVEQLNKKYDLYIVSAALEFPLSLAEKQSWLAQHFPFIHWKQVVFCGSKKIICADIMIDDHFKNLDEFEGHTTILFDQPHNALTDPGKHRRVRNWSEIETILLK